MSQSVFIYMASTGNIFRTDIFSEHPFGHAPYYAVKQLFASQRRSRYNAPPHWNLRKKTASEHDFLLYNTLLYLLGGNT